MISIVVVYNDEQIFKKTLLQSLKNQIAKFELISIDNTKGKFKSAAEALNRGAKQANGKYIMFVHQDIALNSQSWLENAEKNLDNIIDLGIAGVVGMSEKGKNKRERGRGCISDSYKIWQWSRAVQNPEEVQILDECLLIIPKSVFTKIQFDEKMFDNWHCYGADYCLSVRQIKLKAYVIPAFVHHESPRLNSKGILKYQKILYNKHLENYKHIYTTCGEISWLRLKIKTCIEMIRTFYVR